jgi:hypothetical protein
MPKHAPSVYVPLDANYLRDPRIRRAGPEAEHLYLRGLAYAKSGETDGLIYSFDLDVVSIGLNKVPNRVAALVREQAWQEHPEGWFITGWFNWNEPVDKLREQKKKRAEGAAKTNHKKHTSGGHPFVGTCPVCLGDVDA